MIFDKVGLRKMHVFPGGFRPHTGPGRTHTGPYGSEKSKKIRKQFASIGAFKGPVTLPQVTVCFL